MFSEALSYLVKLGQQANAIEKVHLSNRKFLIRQGSAHSIMDVEPDPRNHFVEGVDSLMTVVSKLIAAESLAMVFVGEDKIVVHLDGALRSDVVTMRFIPTPQLLAVRSLLASKVKQKDLVRVLREQLAGCCPVSLLPIIRRLDFKRASDGRSHVSHGKESLGRSVEAVVQSTEGEIPETVWFELPAYIDFSMSTQISFESALTVDATEEHFAFGSVGSTFANELQRLRLEYVTYIKNELLALGCTNCSVVLGTP